MSVWKVYAKKADFQAIGQKYGIDQVVARVIRNRDVLEENSLDLYIRGTRELMYAPRSLKDVEKATNIIKEKILNSSRIRIIGDYDIDGICSIYILYKALKIAGAKVDFVVPHRITDGYGINESLIKNAYDNGIDTIITCDNGIAAIEQIDYAKSLGMTVIITDHHDIPFLEENGEIRHIYPNADAIVNPKQKECLYPFKGLCGAGVAYKLAQVLLEDLSTEQGIADKLLDDLSEFVAIATVGDIMELKDENRIIVKYGLKHIKNTENIGLQALIDVCGLEKNNISAYHIGFVIGPCLNSSGRLDTAERALALLLETDSDKAQSCAESLKALNDERKNITVEETGKAIALIESSDLIYDSVLVVYLSECHESIAGIIAGRLRERFYRPSIVLTDAEEGVKGSGRSIEGYNMFEEISRCRPLLTKFGGHPMAAGMSLSKDNVEEFRKKLNDNVSLTEEQLIPVTWIDVPMPVDYVTTDLIRQFDVLEPFGNGNEKPVFADKNLRIKSISIIGKNKNVLKMLLENERGYLADGVMFQVTDTEALKIGQNISILYYPDINTYNGRSRLQFRIIEWKDCTSICCGTQR